MVQRPDSVNNWLGYEREKTKKAARFPTYMIKQMGPLYQRKKGEEGQV